MSDISIFLGGSMAIEALMLGVNPLVYISNSNFSHNPLVEYLEHIRYAFDRNSLEREINSLTEMCKAKDQMRIVYDMFNDINTDPYNKFIEKIIAISNRVII